VRRARPDEPLDSVAKLQNLSFSRPWSAEAIGWELKHTDVARLYVLEDVDEKYQPPALIGYCACWLVMDELHVNSLAIRPEVRRRGHARRLLLEVFHDVANLGVTSATLEVRRSNAGAVALYRNLGFQVEGVRPNYYQQPREDALILWHRDLQSLGNPAASRSNT